MDAVCLRFLGYAHDALWWVRETVVFRLIPPRRDFDGPPWRRGEWHEQPLQRRIMLTVDEPLQHLDQWLVENIWQLEDRFFK